MKKLVAVLLTLCFICTNNMFVFANEKDFNDYSTNEIISSFDLEAKDTKNEKEMIDLGNKVFQKRGEIGVDQALDIIKNDSYSTELRALMCDVLLMNPNFKGINDYSLQKILFDESIEYQLKHNIIWILSDDIKNIDTLKTIATDSKNKLSFHAIKKLYTLDENAALGIADSILDNYKNEDIEKVQASIKIKAKYLGNTKNDISSIEKKEFTDECILLFDNFKDKTSRDTITFALSDIKDESALLWLINNEDVPKENKAFCINDSKEILLKIVNNKNKGAYDSIKCAMDIYPISEIQDSLYKSSPQNSTERDIIISPLATGYQGYAVFRKGVLTGLAGHSGLMISPSSTAAYPVMEAYSNGMRKASWNTFMDSLPTSNYWGTYGPKVSITSSKRDLVVGTANNLYSEYPGYTFGAPLGYPASLFGNAKLYPSDIVNVRCDGVVEYSYEYNLCQIFGTSYWNISIPSINSINTHSTMSPLGQNNSMALITSNLPI